MSWLLVRYDRFGAARYLSHLDTARAIQRTFARAGIAVARSRGMRPKARLSLGLPLPVGTAAENELILVELAGDEAGRGPLELLRALRAAAPEGLAVAAVDDGGQRPRLTPLQAEYECDVAGEAAALERALAWFAEQSEVPVERVSPKGRKVVDLKKYVEDTWVRPRARGARLGFSVRHAEGGAARPQEFVRLVAERAGAEPVMRDLLRRRVTYKGLPAQDKRASGPRGMRTRGRTQRRCVAASGSGAAAG